MSTKPWTSVVGWGSTAQVNYALLHSMSNQRSLEGGLFLVCA